MGRKPKKKPYLLLHADAIYCVSKERVFDPASDADPSLADELQCPPADEVLIALRKAFSLTYPNNHLIDGVQKSLGEIRRIGVHALKSMPEILFDLGASTIPLFMGDPTPHETHLFQFIFVRSDLIDIAVKAEGKKRRLLNLVDHADGTQLIATLRSVVSDTFAEAHDEDQHMAILRTIRRRIHEVLPPFNPFLEAIEVEAISERISGIEQNDESDESVADTAP